MLLSATADKLEEHGVETLGIVATTPARARPFFRLHPPRIRLGADPELATHRAYGVPNEPATPELWAAVHAAAVSALRGLRHTELPGADAYDALGRLDGYIPAESDLADARRHGAQRTGQFLIDRDGIVRWVNIECARDGLAGINQMPPDEELVAAARDL